MARLLSRLRTARRGSCSQAGYTLIELVIVVAVSALVLGPLLAWAVLVIQQQPVQRDGAVATAEAGVLGSYFPDDVTVAGAADDYTGAQPTGEPWDTRRQECVGGGGQGGRALLVLLSQGEDPVKTIYAVAPTRDDGTVVVGNSSIWRSVCDADDGSLLSATQVVSDVVDDPARTTSACFPEPPAPPTTIEENDICRQVRLTVATEGRVEPFQLSATRRTDSRSLVVDPTGNFLPVAKIDEVSRVWLGPGTPAFDYTLSAASSNDAEDGSALSYLWELPTGPEGSGAAIVTDESVEPSLNLPAIGDYWVRLTVTDSDGARNSTYRKLTVLNRSPEANIVVTPDEATAGAATIDMSAAGSSDPDGGSISVRWRLTSALDAGEGLVQEFTTETATWAVPEWVVGAIVAELSVTDDENSSTVTAKQVIILDPVAPPEDPDEVPDPSDPPEPGAPVADFVATVGSGNSVTFDASGSTGTITSYDWDFGLLAGTGTGETVTKVYPGPGSYTVVLTVTDDEGRSTTRALRVVIPGAPVAPSNVRTAGGDLVWDPRPGARRYLVDMRSSSNSCAREILDQAVAASEAPRKALPPNPCGAGSTATARVGVENVAGGPIAWSGWIDVTAVVK